MSQRNSSRYFDNNYDDNPDKVEIEKDELVSKIKEIVNHILKEFKPSRHSDGSKLVDFVTCLSSKFYLLLSVYLNLSEKHK